ncbi:unnamed protein product [Dicrocoelium dendriticum]|nr:unnamed protein product [Dicrocoelium dendriticum]
MLPTVAEYNSRGDVGLYSRAVKTRDWWNIRESEPRGYDFSSDPIRSCQLSTYRRLGVDDRFSGETTYMAFCSDRLNTAFKQRRQMLFACATLMDPIKLKTLSLLEENYSSRNTFQANSTYRNDFVIPTLEASSTSPTSSVSTDRPIDKSAVRRRMLPSLRTEASTDAQDEKCGPLNLKSAPILRSIDSARRLE